MSQLVVTQEQCTKEWLTRALRSGGWLHSGEVISVTRTKVPEGSTSQCCTLALSYSAGASGPCPRSLFYKAPKPRILPVSSREVELYRSIAPAMPSAPLVRCYDAAYSAKRGTYHLLLEDVSPTHRVIDNGFPPTQDQAQRIVDALAEFHAFWWDHPRLGRDIGELPTEYSIRRLIGHAECYLTRMLDRLEDRLSSEGEQAYRLAFSKHGSLLIQRLTRGKHLTLVHGDAHARNFMLPRGANSGPTYIIDWYVPHWVWRCFLGVSDLAYLMVRFWDPARRRSLERPLLERYHERLQQRGVKGYSADGMLWDYRLSAILSLYIVVEEAVRSEPSRWYPQLCHALAAFEELDCSALLRSSCQSNT